MNDTDLISLASQLLAIAGMKMEDLSPAMITVAGDRCEAVVLTATLESHARICNNLAVGAQALLDLCSDRESLPN